MNRRSFIKKSGLFAGTLFISLKSYPFDRREKKITGRVHSLKSGLQDVVVSDGYSVVVTDKNGYYSIEPNENARFLWVSTPAGYEFNTESSLARHYEGLGSRNQYDFQLKPLSVDDSRHNFIIWADPQVKDKSDVAQMMETAVPDVKKLVEAMGRTPVHGIGVGDLVWDNHALFPDYEKAVAGMGIPFFQALGNHDQDYRRGGDETSDATFSEHFGPTYYSFNRGKAHYVVLDDVRYLGEDRKYDGYVNQQQLDWLKKDLQLVPKDNLVIVCLHIPVYSQVKNNTDLYDLLKPFKNVHIMSGHTHYNINNIQNGIFEHNHGTVCGAWWTGPVCGDGTPRGYGVYEVNGTELKWYYKATGREKEYQLSIDIESLHNQKRFIANVWNWDPQWKVEWWADDKYMGEPENIKGFDPLTIRLYKGGNLPAKRPFAEPHKTDHLFVGHFAPSVKNVKVVATDRFGQKFTAELNG